MIHVRVHAHAAYVQVHGVRVCIFGREWEGGWVVEEEREKEKTEGGRKRDPYRAPGLVLLTQKPKAPQVVNTALHSRGKGCTALVHVITVVKV